LFHLFSYFFFYSSRFYLTIGTKAVTKANATRYDMPQNKPTGVKGKIARPTRVSREKKAGLTFPIARVKGLMQGILKLRIGASM
jgi:hypothetical protein